ncbi:ABC-type multidrug transport system fused ATPase/permease subunit [Streptomyces brevispora]|uniref:ABC-type multidrug transport system fused ATPase/permease subunit n=1 Tax=Streptomyces brevispora TaxID=887462 RepID=A0A561UXE8_9ACTN|nr:ABC transporter ATP-binding protein [Streptomyces brevispora]TWG04017.1 ABC-type multidrug transport system fused ATPase/permease subunit [Streptomyces brevispora]
MSDLTHTLPVADARTVKRRVQELLLRFKGWLTAIVLVHAGATVCALIPPLVLGEIIDKVSAHQELSLLQWATVIAVALLVGAVLEFTAAKWSFVLGERVFSLLRMQFLTGLLAMPLRRVERADAGEILSRSTSDMDALQEVTRTGLPETIVGSVTTAMTLGCAFVINPLLALGCLVGFPPMILATRWYVRRSEKVYGDELEARAAVSSQVTESVRGHEVIETLKLEKVRKSSASRVVARAAETARGPIRLEQRAFPVIQVGYHLPLLVVVGWGAWLVRGGSAEVGQVAAIALYMRAILSPLDDLIYWFGEAQPARAALGRILGVVGDSAAPEHVVPKGRTPLEQHEALSVRQLSFGYVDGTNVLNDIDLTVRTGERVCVVGASGAGKTTLALLLAGILTPTSGSIGVAGAGGSDDTRLDVVLMTQEDHVFGGTIADNLTLARSDASEAAVRHALEAVGADGWVTSMDDGLQTRLGADAHTLTPAQARQLSLARLVLMQPRALILDEATAGLSEEESKQFAMLLPTVLQDTTVIQIAHDLWAAQNSDQVVVMDDGSIVERGSHTELLASDGVYTQLWNSWHSATLTPGQPR